MSKPRRSSPQRPPNAAPAAPALKQHLVDQAVATAGKTPFQIVGEVIAEPFAKLEELRGHPVIAYVLTDAAQMADEQMMHLYLHLREIGRQDHLDLFLMSRGGATEVPWKIVSLYREFTKRFSILVPYRAHSSATLTSLGADEIVMTAMSELGPIDPSRRHPMLPKDETEDGKRTPLFISVQDLRHVLEFLKREMGKDLTPDAAAVVYTALFDKVHPLAIGALEQSWALSIQVARQALETHMDPEVDKAKIDHIVDRLSDHYKSHLYQLNRREAAALGLPVKHASAEEEDAMWTLHQAFAGTVIQGEGEIGGQKMTSIGLGYITSQAGVTIGLGHAKANKTDEGIVATTWESKVGPDRPTETPPAAPPAQSEGLPPGR